MTAASFQQRRRKIRPGITDEEADELREAFTWFDTEGTGTIELSEIKAAMLALKFDKKSPTVFQLIVDIEKNRSGPIDFEDFLDEVTSRLGDRESREGIQKIFALFDDDRTNTISFRNLKRVAKEIGETMTDEELREMIERADSNGDGEISFDDFYTIMTKKTFA